MERCCRAQMGNGRPKDRQTGNKPPEGISSVQWNGKPGLCGDGMTEQPIVRLSANGLQVGCHAADAERTSRKLRGPRSVSGTSSAWWDRGVAGIALRCRDLGGVMRYHHQCRRPARRLRDGCVPRPCRSGNGLSLSPDVGRGNDAGKMRRFSRKSWRKVCAAHGR